MNRMLRGALWVFEAMAIVLVVLLLALPIQDYAHREFTEWYVHPSPERLQKLRAKQQEEFRVRLKVAAPFAAAAVFVPFLIFRLRRVSTKSSLTPTQPQR